MLGQSEQGGEWEERGERRRQGRNVHDPIGPGNPFRGSPRCVCGGAVNRRLVGLNFFFLIIEEISKNK